MADPEPEVMQRVRRALGRVRRVEPAPIPLLIEPSIARLVHAGADLARVFAARARDMKMDVSGVDAAQLPSLLVEFLGHTQCRKVALSQSPLIERLGLMKTIAHGGVEAKWWAEMSLEELYDGYDCGITEVAYAVAETGSLVIEPSAKHGRALSLVPMIHVAIVERKNIVADLMDLMEKLAEEGRSRSNIIMITGPSKTADIEMNVVTGVHGPNVVKVFLIPPESGGDDKLATG